MTPLQQLYDDWRDCQRCHLADGRKHVCVVRGSVPCDVLLVGEAPGHSEDVIGVPMVGPAGKLQDEIVADAIPEGVSFAFANICGCIPVGDDGKKVTKPDGIAIRRCMPRLQEIVRLCDPKLIVCLGEVAREYLVDGRERIELHREIPTVVTVHPAAIGRANIAQQGLMRQRAAVQIRNAVEDHVTNGGS